MVMNKTVKPDQLESQQVYPYLEVQPCEACGKKQCECEEVEHGNL